MNRLISRTLSTTKSRLALIEKDAIIHVSWATPSKKLGVAHSKYGDVTVKEVQYYFKVKRSQKMLFRSTLQSHPMKKFHLICLILLTRWEMVKK